MKEAQFLKKRSGNWKKLEEYMRSGKKAGPDELAGQYISLSDDLSYSKTFYPKSKTTAYLNNLAVFVHKKIYRSKKEDRSRFLKFWSTEMPLAIYEARYALMLSFGIFMLAVAIGVLSMSMDPEFARTILGDNYVDETLRNIDRDDPMGIYSSQSRLNMFSFITINNIKVSALAFVAGIFTPMAVGALLLQNGIMLGSFQYFFFQKGVALLSLQAIWIHGTIEITSIVIAGAAGITMGNGWLFPGTYTRLESLKKSSRRGVKILVGLVPFFIIAGFLESFVTRYYKEPWISWPVIAASTLLILWYFVYLPIRLAKKFNEKNAG